MASRALDTANGPSILRDGAPTSAGLHIGIIRNVAVRHLAGVEMNRQYGYLDICKLKYSDDPIYETCLEETYDAMKRGDEK